jgi:hypothetical protein
MVYSGNETYKLRDPKFQYTLSSVDGMTVGQVLAIARDVLAGKPVSLPVSPS